MKSAIEITRWV